MNNRIFDSKTSKIFLHMISSSDSLTSLNTFETISIKELVQLKAEYINTKKNIEASGLDLNTLPRNYVYYEMIKKRIKHFSWCIYYDEYSNKYHVVFDSPRFKGKELSLFSLLFNEFQYDLLNNKFNHFIGKLPLHIYQDLDILFKSIDVISPDKKNMGAIIDWVKEGLSGEPLTIFSLSCPDYSVEETDNQLYPYRHTFKKLGSDVSMVTKRILDTSQALNAFFSKNNINCKKIIAIADYEALSENTRNIVNLDYEHFMQNLISSMTCINHHKDSNTTCIMFTELCNGQEEWKKLLAIHELQFNKGDFGLLSMTSKQLMKILRARKKLYDRWFGEKKELTAHLPNLLMQSAEYATVGGIVSKKFKNCLILGADHPALSIFYSTKKFTPTLYLNRYYI